MGHGAKKDRLTEQAIAALLSNATIRAAAEAVAVDERTLRDWLKDPEFKADYLEARRACLTQATGALTQAATKAVSALTTVMDDPESPPQVRVSAARTILDLAYKGAEIEDITARIERLELENSQAKYR